MTETQVGAGNAAGLLRVILEISLRILIGVVADNLDRGLVRRNSTVRA